MSILLGAPLTLKSPNMLSGCCEFLQMAGQVIVRKLLLGVQPVTPSSSQFVTSLKTQ